MATGSPSETPGTRSGPRLLFVKLKHIGDALLLTPTLMAVRRDYPNAEIWVVVREGTEGILAGCPAIDRIVTTTPVESSRRGPGTLWRDFRTWLLLRRQRFDYAFELTDGDRGRWFAGMSGAQNRCVNISLYGLNRWWRLWFNRISDTAWRHGHRVEKDFQGVADFLPLEDEIPPLCFEHAATREPTLTAGLQDFVVLHPGTRWIRKRWPKDYWIHLGHELLKHTRTLVVSCGPNEAEKRLAAELIAAWGEGKALSTDGKTGWAELAGILYRARAFIGVDTAAMHLAAACQCPSAAIFGHSVVGQWSPWKAPHSLIHLGDQMTEKEIRLRPPEEIMQKLLPERVLTAALEIIRPATPAPADPHLPDPTRA